MIAHLQGKVLRVSLKFVVVEVAGVGYRVFATAQTLASLDIGAECNLFTHHHQREDGQELYGFRTIQELEMFDLLLTVNGVGPKSALGVLSRATVADITRAVHAGEISILTKVSGIGAKTAERIVRELNGKLEAPAEGAATGVHGGDDEVVAALEQLGYTPAEAHKALAKVPSTVTDPAQRIKAVLRAS
ncbi:MAG: Holliday junction branch migration protein RuvA [bacterium]|nr:Holliday junction branch migration protein RuvA [bacterium]